MPVSCKAIRHGDRDQGNGNNSLVLQTGSTIIGTANGGAGSNTVTLQGTGTASIRS